MKISTRFTTIKKGNVGGLGIAYIELLLVLPVILMIAFGSIELARIYRFQQVLSSISRESAYVSFKECAHLTDDAAVRSCLENHVFPLVIQNYAHKSMPGVEVVVSVFGYEHGSDSVRLTAQFGIDESTGLTQAHHQSRHIGMPSTLFPNWPNDMYSPISRQHFGLNGIGSINPVIVISEVFYDYAPIIVNTLPYHSAFSIKFYEPTIF